MPSVKRCALKILNENEYGEAQAELIGKAVVLTDGKAGAVENVWLDELHGLRISIKGHDGKWPGLNHQVCGELDHSHRLRAAQSVLLSDQSNQDEKSDLCQESDAHNGDRKERVAR
jgi:hypothetical protein